ncbi:hypothetical protein [Gimibacter soli]|uniref:Glycosyltransferase family 92 protein n=1 Tax=Gimibacter soli TaxID=3024400 RepID=A0AAE9XS46_9PROT|nr:hypothetical protein [Gimibacter soli]WCL55144.1 hypothetical protein PH603_05150 [Gimibacter soli]
MSPILLTMKHLSPIILAENGPVLREAPRPPELQQPGYDAAFDKRTLFYDTFIPAGGRKVRLLGPSLLNLESELVGSRITVTRGDTYLEHVVQEDDIVSLRKIFRMDVPLPQNEAGDVFLKLESARLGTHEVQVRFNRVPAFTGRKVLFTLFKYEPLAWIRDWVEFNIRYHGADAVLLYNNDSPLYTTEEIAAGIADIPGLREAAVVEWSFPYGPGAYKDSKWDSNFCQFGVFDHARWRFLVRAAGVLNTDIDELLVTHDHRSIFDILEETPSGFLRFEGNWVTGARELDMARPVEERRHRDYDLMGGDSWDDSFSGKWAVVPRKTRPRQQWCTHFITGKDNQFVPREEMFVRHFCNINMNWKKDRSGPLLNERSDTALIEAYRRVGWRD